MVPVTGAPATAWASTAVVVLPLRNFSLVLAAPIDSDGVMVTVMPEEASVTLTAVIGRAPPAAGMDSVWYPVIGPAQYWIVPPFTVAVGAVAEVPASTWTEVT